MENKFSLEFTKDEFIYLKDYINILFNVDTVLLHNSTNNSPLHILYHKFNNIIPTKNINKYFLKFSYNELIYLKSSFNSLILSISQRTKKLDFNTSNILFNINYKLHSL